MDVTTELVTFGKQLLAVVLGGLVGFERELAARPAGLVVRGLSIAFGGVRAANDVSFEAPPGGGILRPQLACGGKGLARDRAVPGENAVDTKASAGNARSTLVIRDSVASGFRGGFGEPRLFDGTVVGTMLRNEIFDFAQLGIYVERADNTARLLDVKFHELTGGRDFFGTAAAREGRESRLVALVPLAERGD